MPVIQPKISGEECDYPAKILSEEYGYPYYDPGQFELVAPSM